MSASVYLMIVDPESGAVIMNRWVGLSSVRERAREVLQRPPDHEATGFASWGRLTVAEASLICEAHDDDGITPAEVEQLGVEHPGERFWWALHVDS